MKKVVFILVATLAFASCKKEEIKPNTPICTVSDSDKAGTYSRLIGEWQRTYVYVNGAWKVNHHNFEVTKTTLDNVPYEVVGKDKVKLNTGVVLDFDFTQDTSIVYVNGSPFEKWTL